MIELIRKILAKLIIRNYVVAEKPIIFIKSDIFDNFTAKKLFEYLNILNMKFYRVFIIGKINKKHQILVDLVRNTFGENFICDNKFVVKTFSQKICVNIKCIGDSVINITGSFYHNKVNGKDYKAFCGPISGIIYKNCYISTYNTISGLNTILNSIRYTKY